MAAPARRAPAARRRAPPLRPAAAAGAPAGKISPPDAGVHRAERHHDPDPGPFRCESIERRSALDAAPIPAAAKGMDTVHTPSAATIAPVHRADRGAGLPAPAPARARRRRRSHANAGAVEVGSDQSEKFVRRRAADRKHRAADRAAARKRQRRCRAREKRGLKPAQLLVRKKAITTALVRSGSLTEVEARQWALVERELAEIVELWAARWARVWNV
jgi:hypothetical protein